MEREKVVYSREGGGWKSVDLWRGKVAPCSIGACRRVEAIDLTWLLGGCWCLIGVELLRKDLVVMVGMLCVGYKRGSRDKLYFEGKAVG